MATEIAIRYPEDPDRLSKITEWLLANIGPGSHRTIKNSFMGMDDWFSYDNTPDEDEMDEQFEITDGDEYQAPDIVFAFRRETDATLFALKWQTATAM